MIARRERRSTPSANRLGGHAEVEFRAWYACTACDGEVGKDDAYCSHCGAKLEDR